MKQTQKASGRFTDHWHRIAHDRVGIVDAPDCALTYYIRKLSGRYLVLCVNESGAYCWCRERGKPEARKLAKDAFDAGGFSIGPYRTAWPSRFTDIPGGFNDE